MLMLEYAKENKERMIKKIEIRVFGDLGKRMLSEFPDFRISGEFQK